MLLIRFDMDDTGDNLGPSWTWYFVVMAGLVGLFFLVGLLG